MRHRILIQQGAYPAALEERLQQTYDARFLPMPGPERDALIAECGAGIEGIATSARFGVDSALLRALPKLKVVSSFGVGLDTIDVGLARALGIAVGYTPDVLNDCVADTAFALLMDVARNVSAADRFVRRGGWLRGSFPAAARVSGKRLGILGLGRIGQAIARRAAGFDMEVRYHNRRQVAGCAYGYEPDLQSLARWCDFLVIAAAGGADTRGLVSRPVLDALGPQGYLINISRGSVVDQAELVAALQEQRLAGAGLDVFDREPHVPPALFALDNVVLLPHVGSSTHETRADMARRVEENLAAFFDGRPLVSAAT